MQTARAGGVRLSVRATEVIPVVGSADTKREQLAEFLRSQAHTGEYYFKSKFIAEELGLSPKEIGVLMTQLQESVSDLEIEKWSNSRATTWRVEHQAASG